MWRSPPNPSVQSCSRKKRRKQQQFTVGDIRVEGLQRISEGTVFNYLPVNIGDHLDGQRIGEAMRALYATGFFRDVELRRDGNTLLVVVVERPSIAKFEIKGNKDIKTEDLQKSLRNVGLATGKIFDRSVLDEVKQYLTDQYFSRGKYAVRVDTKVTDLPGNKVDVVVDIKEGKRAKIRMINLVGNTRLQGKGILAEPRAEDAELAVLVQAGRSLFARIAAGRSGEDPLVLHGSRLREFSDRVDASRDRARKRRHVHHRERQRGRGV